MAQPPADYYRILGVAPDATEAELKIAYRNRARQCHPDQNPGDPAAEERFKELQVAYSVLSVPAERARMTGCFGPPRPSRNRVGGAPKSARWLTTSLASVEIRLSYRLNTHCMAVRCGSGPATGTAFASYCRPG